MAKQDEQLMALSDDSRDLISNLTVDVQELDLIKHDWSTSLAAAPVSIGILGECMLVSSFKNASRIVIDYPDRKSQSLPTSLLEIVQVGSTAFIKAEIGMGQINTLSRRISMQGGTVDKVARYALKKPTPTIKKLFQIELAALKKASESCASEAKMMLEHMEAWGEHVNKVWLALTDKEGAVYREQLEKEKERKKQREEEAKLAAAAAQTKRQLESSRAEVLQTTEAGKQRRANIKKYGDDAALVLSAISIASPLLGGAMFGLTALYLYTTNPKTEQAEKLYKMQLEELEKARNEEEKLAREIEALADESKSLEDVKKTIARAISKMVELHDNIRQMLLYFEGTSKMVDNIHQHQETEFAPILQIEDVPEDEEDAAELRTAMLEKAFQVKVQFVTMHKIAEAYNDISHEFITGGFHQVGQLGLSSTSETEGQVAEKQKQLKAFRDKYRETVPRCTQQRQRELQTLLQADITKCAKGTLAIQNGFTQ